MVKIIKKILDIILLLTIIIIYTYLVLSKMNKVVIYNIKTGSMEDNIHVGDHILIVKQNDYKIGDVVTYKKDNGYITHRIIKIDQDKITTKGDANNVEDESVDKKRIVGKVVYSGKILNIIFKYKYMIACLLLSVYLFTYFFTKSDDKEIEQE